MDVPQTFYCCCLVWWCFICPIGAKLDQGVDLEDWLDLSMNYLCVCTCLQSDCWVIFPALRFSPKNGFFLTVGFFREGVWPTPSKSNFVCGPALRVV